MSWINFLFCIPRLNSLSFELTNHVSFTFTLFSDVIYSEYSVTMQKIHEAGRK